MRIKTLKLKNFKRFHDLTIDLGDTPAKVVALVGPNGCGKSSIFDAFEEKLKEQKGANYQPPPEFFGRSYYSAVPASTAYVRSESVQITPSNSSALFTRKSFYIRTSYRFTPRLDVNELRTQPDVLQDQARPSSSSELDSRLTENYQRLQGKMIAEWDTGTKSGPQFREEEIGKLNAILEKVLDIRVSSLGSIVNGKGRLYFTKGTSTGFPYDNLSSGEKEVIDILLDLIVKVGEFNDTIFAIDEPELHLNTAIQRSLIVELEKLIPESCQLWVATHSIGFLRALQVDLRDKVAIVDLSGADLDVTVLRQPMVPTRSNWQRIFSTALDDLTGLVAPKTIVYCEGRAEPDDAGLERGLDADVYNTIFEREFPEVLFVSSGGNTEPRRHTAVALKVLSKAFSDVSLLLLSDRDIKPDGTQTTMADRAAWISKSPSFNRMLIRREIENYLFDYEIVSRRGVNLSGSDYAGFIGDITDGDVKAKGGALLGFLGIHTGLSIENLKRELASLITPETNVYKELRACVFPAT